LSDETDGTELVWESVSQWAAEWFPEWRATSTATLATSFIRAACDDAVAGVVDDALVMLAETADGDEELAWVGAGPLEDLVSHSGNGLRVLADVERAARQNAAFRAALNNTCLGSDVSDVVRGRLAGLGARVLDRS